MDHGLLATAAIAAALCGCIVVTEPEPSIGTLTARWTIEGSTDPVACAAHGAQWTRLVVTAGDGAPEATLTPACTAFASSVGLYAGWHQVALTMLDATGRPVSTTVTTPVDIGYDRTSTVHADFPANSFFARAP